MCGSAAGVEFTAQLNGNAAPIRMTGSGLAKMFFRPKFRPRMVTWHAEAASQAVGPTNVTTGGSYLDKQTDKSGECDGPGCDVRWKRPDFNALCLGWGGGGDGAKSRGMGVGV